ncbi:proteasome-type protease [Gilvimarinus sp. SDUM040013]|uniref:Proteasome-type protease n=1 Tax=Gilvimarinus gilvus TaxID=3058038 RepID=A0ABU4RW20_9GAMM|nr:proteasome-type protease [Gilvimarinus sp. SDUM040013]MDO3386494.1 proteasome-type protease [Gilvimarinus sp. SDUM040013]MDX6849070.1 proteasome-type protease [Gilvimarinus sp. SDUM040013]
MTYCVAITMDAGLIFCSDSRTNAGVDQVSTYSKMFHYKVSGEREFVVLSAGNLATTQAVVSQIKRDIRDDASTSLKNLPDISEAASYLGEISRQEQEKHSGGGGPNAGASFEASFILGGQVEGDKPRLAMVYPQGNHITTSKDTPYLQIGESKYGKPILDRILSRTTSLEDASRCALVSMDSTMRSNLTVGPPIELAVYATDSFNLTRFRFDDDDEYLRELKKAWDQYLIEAFDRLPPLQWSDAQSPDESA